MQNKIQSSLGFTLVELVMVIIILAVLSATALPKFINVSSDAKKASLKSIAGSMQSTINLVVAKAITKGLQPHIGGGANQADYLVDFGQTVGSAELDYRNLCPESRAEMGEN